MVARIPSLPSHERVIWEGRSAWVDQAILFIFIGAAALRLLVAVRYGQWLTAGCHPSIHLVIECLVLQIEIHHQPM